MDIHVFRLRLAAAFTIFAVVLSTIASAALLQNPAPPRPTADAVETDVQLVLEPQVPTANAPEPQPALLDRPLARRTSSGVIQLWMGGELANYDVPLRSVLDSLSLTPRSIEIEVDKSDRMLRLIVNGEHVKSYPMGLGGNPDADKTRRGDSATPEGDFYVCQKLPSSSFYLSLKLSYPNIEDARAGLERGLINRATHNRIVSAISSRKMPPMNTRLGGDICIHGGGAGKPVTSGGEACSVSATGPPAAWRSTTRRCASCSTSCPSALPYGFALRL